jgi:hypothetical protein
MSTSWFKDENLRIAADNCTYFQSFPSVLLSLLKKLLQIIVFVYEQNGELPWRNRSDRAQFLAIWDKAVIWKLNVFQIGLL